jgi:tRNA 2-thiouridine synthesizing protein A
MITIDARGHRCPVPTLRLQKALESAASGERLVLLADDPMARIDVPHFAAENGHSIVASDVAGPSLSFTVQKG